MVKKKHHKVSNKQKNTTNSDNPLQKNTKTLKNVLQYKNLRFISTVTLISLRTLYFSIYISQ